MSELGDDTELELSVAPSLTPQTQTRSLINPSSAVAENSDVWSPIPRVNYSGNGDNTSSTSVVLDLSFQCRNLLQLDVLSALYPLIGMFTNISLKRFIQFCHAHLALQNLQFRCIRRRF